MKQMNYGPQAQQSRAKGSYLTPQAKAGLAKIWLRMKIAGAVALVCFIWYQSGSSTTSSASAGYSQVEMVGARESGTYNQRQQMRPAAPIERPSNSYISLTDYMEGLTYQQRYHIGQEHQDLDFANCRAGYACCKYLAKNLTRQGVAL